MANIATMFLSGNKFGHHYDPLNDKGDQFYFGKWI